MSKLTRLATTVVARYPEAKKAADGYYLDGRIKRGGEEAADITLDREDRGFFYALYSSAAPEDSSGRNDQLKRNSLDRVMNDMKNNPEKDIDEEINELADAAVNVAGRMTLDDDESRQPYFAGLMVKNAEIAAVTLGRGCAFLYRQDILYPLTDDDLKLDAIDTAGNPVPNFNIYKAGSAATIRYSNIAQLQADDCVILCNKEVLQAVSQKELLQLLFDAEDACDAASRVRALCAERIPERSIQFMIGFVEDILATKKEHKTMMETGYAPVVKDSSGTGKVPIVSASGRMPRNEREDAHDYMPLDDEEEGKRGKAAFLTVLALILLLLALFFLGKQMGFTDRLMDRFFPTTTTTTVPPTTTPAPTTTPPPTTTTKAPTTTTTTAPTTTAPQMKKHIIQEGELLATIIDNEYAEYNLTPEQKKALMEQIIKANPEVFKGPDGSLYEAGSEIVLPVPKT